jgi:hypothetical protein
VGAELASFDTIHVPTAFVRLGKLCHAKSFPSDITREEEFRGLLSRACDMCGDSSGVKVPVHYDQTARGRWGDGGGGYWMRRGDALLQARAVANITHALATMGSAGKLASDASEVQRTLVGRCIDPRLTPG